MYKINICPSEDELFRYVWEPERTIRAAATADNPGDGHHLMLYRSQLDTFPVPFIDSMAYSVLSFFLMNFYSNPVLRSLGYTTILLHYRV